MRGLFYFKELFESSTNENKNACEKLLIRALTNPCS